VVGDGGLQDPEERQEHVFLHAGQDHGIGVRLSCTSDVSYLDPAPHGGSQTNAFSPDGFPDTSRTITMAIITPRDGPLQAVKKHGQCIRTSDGSQMYTCSETVPADPVCDTTDNIHTAPCDEAAQTLTLARNLYRVFQASSVTELPPNV
jgi:hypothetical protein